MRKLAYSFFHAFRGIKEAFKTQPNFRIHIVSALLVTILGLLFHINIVEWIFIAMSVMFVVVTELLNTATEFFADLIKEEYNLKIRMVKDISAAAVLITVISSFIVGVIIFIPKIYKVLLSIF